MDSPVPFYHPCGGRVEIDERSRPGPRDTRRRFQFGQPVRCQDLPALAPVSSIALAREGNQHKRGRPHQPLKTGGRTSRRPPNKQEGHCRRSFIGWPDDPSPSGRGRKVREKPELDQLGSEFNPHPLPSPSQGEGIPREPIDLVRRRSSLTREGVLGSRRASRDHGTVHVSSCPPVRSAIDEPDSPEDGS